MTSFVTSVSDDRLARTRVGVRNAIRADTTQETDDLAL